MAEWIPIPGLLPWELLQRELSDAPGLGHRIDDAVALRGRDVERALDLLPLVFAADDPLAVGGRLAEGDVNVVGEGLGADGEGRVAFPCPAVLAGGVAVRPAVG